MSKKTLTNATGSPVDLTKVWLHADFPLIEVGERERGCA